MAPNQNGMIVKSKSDDTGLGSQTNRVIVSPQLRQGHQVFSLSISSSFPTERSTKRAAIWHKAGRKALQVGDCLEKCFRLHLPAWHGNLRAHSHGQSFHNVYRWVNGKCHQIHGIILHRFLGFVFAIIGSYGISSGAHRLWCHKSYKANMKMKIMLLFFQTIAFQNCVIEWVRDHRVHHKFSDTNADPHNASRGFFFSHMGWLMCKKHPDVKKYGAKIDMSDLESEKILKFQEKWAYQVSTSWHWRLFMTIFPDTT